MIKIEKPRQGPEILRSKGATEARRNSNAYRQAPAAFEAIGGQPNQRFAFDARIYGHASVREALRECQHIHCKVSVR